MRSAYRNVKVVAVNNGDKEGFNIYLDFSGQREFLVHHRRNGLLYNFLKGGVRTEELRRWTPSARRGVRRLSGHRLQGMISHLIAVVDDYTQEREECRAALE